MTTMRAEPKKYLAEFLADEKDSVRNEFVVKAVEDAKGTLTRYGSALELEGLLNVLKIPEFNELAQEYKLLNAEDGINVGEDDDKSLERIARFKQKLYAIACSEVLDEKGELNTSFVRAFTGTILKDSKSLVTNHDRYFESKKEYKDYPDKFAIVNMIHGFALGIQHLIASSFSQALSTQLLKKPMHHRLTLKEMEQVGNHLSFRRKTQVEAKISQSIKLPSVDGFDKIRSDHVSKIAALKLAYPNESEQKEILQDERFRASVTIGNYFVKKWIPHLRQTLDKEKVSVGFHDQYKLKIDKFVNLLQKQLELCGKPEFDLVEVFAAIKGIKDAIKSSKVFFLSSKITPITNQELIKVFNFARDNLFVFAKPDHRNLIKKHRQPPALPKPLGRPRKHSM